MSRLDYPFYVNGIDERVKWDKFAKSIWSDLYSCAMWNHWSYFDKRVHIFEEYGDVNPKSLGFFSCAYCGATGVDLDLEHILPRKHYPELAFDPDNIVTACKCCNKEKANKVGESVGKKILPFQKKLAKKKEKELLEV